MEWNSDKLSRFERKYVANIRFFEQNIIRYVWNETNKKLYFSVADVVEALTDSNDPKQYVKRMKQRDPGLAKGWVQIVPTPVNVCE